MDIRSDAVLHVSILRLCGHSGELVYVGIAEQD